MKNIYGKSRKGGCIFSLIKLLILIVAVLLVAAYFSLGFIADYALKTIVAGTGIEAGVSSVSLSVFDQSVGVRNFYITNPPKYPKGNAMSVGDVFIDADVSPMEVLSKDLIVIDEISVSNVYLAMEYETGNLLINALPKSNLSDIANILSAKFDADKTQNQTTEVQQTKSDSKPMKFIIKKMIFKDGSIRAGIDGQTIKIPLPSFTIENIGVNEGGATAGQVIGKIIEVVAKNATVNVVKAVAKNAIKDTSKEVQKGTSDIINSISNAFKDL